MEWILIKEKKPPLYTDILLTDGVIQWVGTTFNNLDVYLGSHPDSKRAHKHECGTDFTTYAKLTHWMPLPKLPNNKFFYQGKSFEKEEDFWAYVNEFSSKQTTEEDFESLFKMVKKDVWLNLSMRKTKINNVKLQLALQEALLFILEKCGE